MAQCQNQRRHIFPQLSLTVFLCIPFHFFALLFFGEAKFIDEFRTWMNFNDIKQRKEKKKINNYRSREKYSYEDSLSIGTLSCLAGLRYSSILIKLTKNEAILVSISLLLYHFHCLLKVKTNWPMQFSLAHFILWSPPLQVQHNVRYKRKSLTIRIRLCGMGH